MASDFAFHVGQRQLLPKRIGFIAHGFVIISLGYIELMVSHLNWTTPIGYRLKSSQIGHSVVGKLC